MTTSKPKTTEEVFEKMKETVDTMVKFADVLERRAKRVTKSTQSDNASLEQQIKRAKPNERMMQPEQTQTTMSDYEFVVDRVNKANQRDTQLFKRLHQGWALVGEEDHGPSMVKLTFTRKQANN